MRGTRMAMAALVLAGCGVPAGPLVQGAGGDACGARAHAGLVLAPAARAAEVSAPGGVRLIRPGDGVTRGHRPDRINVEIDPLGRIVAIRCG